MHMQPQVKTFSKQNQHRRIVLTVYFFPSRSFQIWSHAKRANRPREVYCTGLLWKAVIKFDTAAVSQIRFSRGRNVDATPHSTANTKKYYQTPKVLNAGLWEHLPYVRCVNPADATRLVHITYDEVVRRKKLQFRNGRSRQLCTQRGHRNSLKLSK